jgi:hypothetical protein
MSESDKKTECVKVWMTEGLFKQLSREAAMDDRKLSDFMCLCIDRYLNGSKRQRELEVANRDD